jgi:starvation-inducible DNA-binding protein
MNQCLVFLGVVFSDDLCPYFTRGKKIRSVGMPRQYLFAAVRYSIINYKTMEPEIGITPKNRELSAHILNTMLADEFLLFTKTKNAHWNVEGANFHSLHLFFEEQFKVLDEVADSIGERIRSLGHYAPATLSSFLELTHFSEKLHEKNDGPGFIKELLNDHESLIINFREKVNCLANELKDTGTSDFITGLIETHEKMAWMLRAHIK